GQCPNEQYGCHRLRAGTRFTSAHSRRLACMCLLTPLARRDGTVLDSGFPGSPHDGLRVAAVAKLDMLSDLLTDEPQYPAKITAEVSLALDQVRDKPARAGRSPHYGTPSAKGPMLSGPCRRVLRYLP